MTKIAGELEGELVLADCEFVPAGGVMYAAHALVGLVLLRGRPCLTRRGVHSGRARIGGRCGELVRR